MKRLLLALLLCLIATPASADLDFYVFPYAGKDPVTRYEQNDIIDIQPSSGFIPVPNTSPFMIIRVMTSKTKAEVMAYLDKNATRRRAYYLDESKMSSTDLAYWKANRTIQVAEAVAVSWLSRK